MAFDLNNIFGKTDSSIANPSAGVTPIPSDENLKDSESFVQYGKKLCGVSSGNYKYLPTYLQRVIELEKERYSKSEELKESERAKIKNQINTKNAEKDIQETKLKSTEQQIEEKDNSINEKKTEITLLKGNNSEQNRSAKVKFYFGLVIIAILTIYLFIFYSSTFFSAFFGSETVSDISDAMFNTQALPQAFTKGFGPLIFVCTAPVIFMGLGYALHYFGEQKGWTKYLKVGGCIVITFIFDCLLAYSIAAKCYEFERMNSLQDLPMYNMSMAMNDINVWIVIFCGFVTYMIWGIVLDMVITAYGDFRSNASAISKLEGEIKQLEIKISKLQEDKTSLMNKISVLEGEIRNLENNLNTVKIPKHLIRKAVTDFFAGWNALVGVLQPIDYDHKEAQKHFDNCITNINASTTI